ncbi:MAG: D-alanyl-D-alanine carboxypeptidase, partial [Mesorhizobium sp.]|uniref:D-alanyl-D-alanine carboxypeptidase family protein n=1 Tax=Mesorhizobium sp. TaxID=1871066 RepID=UPI001AC76985|nr:D-alanyl-D-alanine carboxypeptidase [Mesorhizobium sp.]
MSFPRLFPLFQKILVALALTALVAGCTTTTPPDSVLAVPAPPQKYAAIVVDGKTGKQLFEVNSTAQRYPASLTKMRTLYLLFEAMESGRVTKQTQIPVSDHAASQPPTKMRFRRGESIDVDSAIRAIVVKSANDVAVAGGEDLVGSEDQFAAMMTA